MSHRRNHPLFPVTVRVGPMLLRDYFAALAVYGIKIETLTNSADCQIAAEAAYRMANAMLAAQEETEQEAFVMCFAFPGCQFGGLEAAEHRRLSNAQCRADEWNALHPIGSEVMVDMASGRQVLAITAAEAVVDSFCTIKVQLSGFLGTTRLECLHPIESKGQP